MSICLEKVEIAQIAGIIYTENIVVTCRKSKFGNITLLVFSCMFENPQMFFSHFYTPTLAVFRKTNERFRLSQNFEKRDCIMFPLDRLGEQTPEPHLFKLPFYQRFGRKLLVSPFL